MGKYTYETCCIHAKGEDIHEMVDQAREVSYRTFIKYVPLTTLHNLFPGYEKHGLKLKEDWHVGYYRSKYRGKKCYYICHSAIEYIFT